MKTQKLKLAAACLILFLAGAARISAQTTAFNYQGKLTDGGNPANGAHQMQFKLFDAIAGGTQIGTTLSDIPVTVAQGVFSVKLDFGASAFGGANRWLEIAVRRNSGESYVTLSPREQIASSPYAVRTISAAQADDSQKLGGVAASEYVTNTSGGSSFIRNSTTQQTGNFNISGTGTIATQLGVGKLAAPGNRIDSLGTIRSFDTVSTSIVAETAGGTNAWARFYAITPSQRWSWGMSQNFNGNQFYLNDETFGQTRMTIQPNGGAISFPFGIVGIGTTAPNAGLELRGTGALTQQRITDNTSGNSLVLQSGSGANMKVTGYNYNTSSAVPLYLSVDGANTVLNSGGGNVGIGTTTPNAKLTVIGNTTQDLNSFGMPKAMLFVLANGTISRCYNAITGVSMTGGTTNSGCGFTSAGNSGGYQVNLGFSVASRFYSVVTFGGASNKGSYIVGSNATTITVYTFLNSQGDSDVVTSDFFLIVY